MSKEIELPFGGVSDELAHDRQKPLTTRYGDNMQGWDETEQRAMMSRRSGQVKHTKTVLAADTKVSHVCDLVYDNPATTYAALANAVTADQSASLPSLGDCKGLVTDAGGNYYALDGDTGVVKYSPELRKVWKIGAPSLERGSVLRALIVDDSNRVIFAVSGGGDPKKARIFCFEQIEENKTKLLWTIPDQDPADQDPLDVGWFTEALVLQGTSLYAAQNDTVNWKSRVAHYTDLGVPNPTRVKVWDVAYPANDMDISVLDGLVAVAHEPFTNRGNDPRSPETTGTSEDATLPELISNYASRAWCWHSSMDVDGDDTNNANRLDGDIIDTLVDKTGNSRNWYTRTSDVGPTLRKSAIAGKDSLFFNGTNVSMQSAAGLSTLVQYRGLNKTTLPLYAKHQFAVFMLVRVPMDSTLRVLLGQAKDNPTAGYNRERILFANGTYNGGTIAATGNMQLYEESATGSGASGRTGEGTNVTPLPGVFDADGLMLITYVFDHGYDDVASVPTRSCIRVNGRPIDRWTSTASFVFENLNPVTLGFMVYPNATTLGARMQGDVLEYFVLSDSYETSFGQTSAQTQRRLLTCPLYPDGVWGGIGGVTELEQIERFFAHRRGIAHKLPTGHFAALDALAVGTAADMITVAGQVYTLAAAPTTVADEVRIGTSAFATLLNLHHAINGSGTPGTDYGSLTVRHSTVWSPGVYENGNTAARPDLIVTRRDGRLNTTFAVSESTAGVRFNWISGANSVASRDGAGRNVGHYPHDGFLYRTIQSYGGPPRTTNQGSTSVPGSLISPYGMVSVWEPTNGKLKDVLTTNGPSPSHLLPIGGIGYGVRWSSQGDLYNIGPRQAATDQVIAENVDMRKMPRVNGVFVITDGATALTAWTAAPGEQTYHYPRMTVDKWDNVYVPIAQAANATSLIVYKRIAPNTTPGSAALSTVTTLTDDPKGYAVAIDNSYAELPAAFVDPRAERVLLGTQLFSLASPKTLYLLRILSATATRTAVRSIVRLGVCGAGLFRLIKGGAPIAVDAAAFSTAHYFIDSCSVVGRSGNAVRVYVDGATVKVYDPKLDTLTFLRSLTSGEMSKRPKLCASYLNRLFFARFADFPTRVEGSVRGDIYNWNFEPKGEDPVPVAAYRSGLTTTGDHADNVTCMAPHQDDWMVVGGERSVAVMVGDPMQGGQFDSVWQGSGVAFGRAWCFTPDKSFWFITNQAELAVMPPGGLPKVVSRPIAKRLADVLDFSKFIPRLCWNPFARCIHIVLTPAGTGNDLRTDFAYWPDTGAFWTVTYGTVAVQPSAIEVVDGDTAGTRLVLLGSRDGHSRDLSATAPDDDGVIITAGFDINPLAPQGAEMEALFSGLTIVTTRTQGTARWEMFVRDNPEDAAVMVADGEILPGYNTPSVRISGQNVGLRISSPTTHERFAVQRISANARPVGKARARA